MVVFLGSPRPTSGPPHPTSSAGGTGQLPAVTAGASAPSPQATAAAGEPPPATSSAIVPGSVDRTSIHLSATYDADVTLGFDDRTLAVDVSITVTNRSGGGVDRV